jgi:hypothetical protein
MADEQKYELVMKVNDTAADVHPPFWLFHGRWGVLLMAGALGFIWILRACSSIGLDLVSSLLISIQPIVLSIVYVLVFVNGRPPHYGIDVAKQWAFNASEWLYARGLIDSPPQLWKAVKEPENPIK